MQKIIHKKCGGHVGWLLSNLPGYVRASDFIRANGVSPEPGDTFDEYCPECGMRLSRKDIEDGAC